MLLSAEHLSINFGSRNLLEDVSFYLNKGDRVGVIGINGTGKSTFLKVLSGAIEPDGGKISRDPNVQVSFLAQNPEMDDNATVLEQVFARFPKEFRELKDYEAKMMLQSFGITDYEQKVGTLSGGQRKRVSLAAALIHPADVLILDEPTSQLDPIAAADFLATVRKINRELGTTVLITEHRLEDIFNGADRCVVMENGRILADDTPKQVGRLLHDSASDMFAAMPTPVRIYYGCGCSGEAPLTVREGRTWLENRFAGQKISAHLPDEPTFGKVEKPFLSVKDLWYRYEKDAPDVLRGVSFNVPKGSLFAIVGGNGTGKSTTLKSVCGICKPYRGKILLDGQPIGKIRGLFRGNLCMLPQDPASLFTKDTVQGELWEMEKDETRISEIAELCGINELSDSHPCDLSGGEQQRVALAKVLLTDPRLLLLDEPTKGLDNFFKQKLSGILRQLKDKGVTIVMVSHDVEFCAAASDQVSMFFDGQILTTNTPRRFFCANSFYTTAANRMSRRIFPDAVTAEDVMTLVKEAER